MDDKQSLLDDLYWSAGRWVFGGGPIEPLVRLACNALVAGYDGEHLRELAGISVTETDRDGEVLGTVTDALAELGRPLPEEGSEEARAIMSEVDPARQRLLGHALRLLLADINAQYPGIARLDGPNRDYPETHHVTIGGSGGGIFLNFARTLIDALDEVGGQLGELLLEERWAHTGRASYEAIMCAEHPNSQLETELREGIPTWVCRINGAPIAPVGQLNHALTSGRARPSEPEKPVPNYRR